MNHIILRSILIFASVFVFNTQSFAFGGNFDWDSPPSNATPLPPFYKISCTDKLDIRLAGTQRASSLFVTHQPENKMLISEVVDGTLYLSVQKQQEDKPAGPEAMIVSLKSGPLKEIAVRGNCHIDASKVQSYGIELIGQDNGQIYIDGNVKVSKIIAQNHSFIEVIWANSKRLYLNAFDTSLVKIAGTADELLLKTYGESKVDAQYLRTCHVNVSAKQFGFAEVFPLYGMRAFSQDQARVDYYTVPNNAISITQSSGNVLWMGYRN